MLELAYEQVNGVVGLVEYDEGGLAESARAHARRPSAEPIESISGALCPMSITSGAHKKSESVAYHSGFDFV